MAGSTPVLRWYGLLREVAKAIRLELTGTPVNLPRSIPPPRSQSEENRSHVRSHDVGTLPRHGDRPEDIGPLPAGPLTPRLVLWGHCAPMRGHRPPMSDRHAAL